ncbi:MAG: bacteriohemerythrin [Magnetococcales bacterium]|nr:bacteriohemerythrin [Magnetococcales bacterium]
MADDSAEFTRDLSREEFQGMLMGRLRLIKVDRFHQEHITLIGIITDLYANVRNLQRQKPGPREMKALDEVLDRLKGYATFHFQAEEDFMAQHKFPGLDAHIQAHRRFVEALLKVEDRMRKESVTHVLDLMHMTVGWLFDHINQVDMQYSRFVEGEYVKLPDLPQPVAASRETTGKTAPSRKLENFADMLCDVGVERLNSDHRRLVNRMARFATTMTNLTRHKPSPQDWREIDQLLTFLNDFMREHFTLEEQMFTQHGYPQLAQHKREHEVLRNRVTDLTRRLSREREVLGVMDLHQLLFEWFITHIQKSDAAYRDFFQKKGLG